MTSTTIKISLETRKRLETIMASKIEQKIKNNPKEASILLASSKAKLGISYDSIISELVSVYRGTE